MNTSKECPLMDHQLMINYNNEMGPCCHYGCWVEDSHDDRVEKPKFDDLTSYKQKIKEKHDLLKQGIEIPECNYCWVQEKKGITSLRQNILKDQSRFHGAQPGEIIALDIRLNNKCNLACTMCYEGASSLWGKLKEIKENEIAISDAQLELIYENSKNLRYLSIQGGEPFYGDEYIKFIDNLPNKQNIKLDMFSNLITVKSDIVAKWNQEFKGLIINASVDGIDDVYSDIRWPTTWEKWKRNATKVYNILEQNIWYHYSLQAQNLACFPDFIKWVRTNTPKAGIIFPCIEFPRQLSIFSSSQQERDLFISKLDIVTLFDINLTNTSEWKNLVKLITSMADDNQLLQERKEYMNYVYALRANYK